MTITAVRPIGLVAEPIALLRREPRPQCRLRRTEHIWLLKRNIRLAHAVVRLELVARKIGWEELLLTSEGCTDRSDDGCSGKSVGDALPMHHGDPTSGAPGCVTGVLGARGGRIGIVAADANLRPLSASVNSVLTATARAGSEPSHRSGNSSV